MHGSQRLLFRRVNEKASMLVKDRLAQNVSGLAIIDGEKSIAIARIFGHHFIESCVLPVA